MNIWHASIPEFLFQQKKKQLLTVFFFINFPLGGNCYGAIFFWILRPLSMLINLISITYITRVLLVPRSKPWFKWLLIFQLWIALWYSVRHPVLLFFLHLYNVHDRLNIVCFTKFISLNRVCILRMIVNISLEQFLNIFLNLILLRSNRKSFMWASCLFKFSFREIFFGR